MTEVQKRRVGRFKVSGDLLGEMLALPQGSRVLRVESGGWEGRLGPRVSVELYVESPGLPEVPEDELVPQVMPEVQSNRYAVETLVSAVNHYLRLLDAPDNAPTPVAVDDMRRAVAAVQSAGGTLVRFLDWHLPHARDLSLSANGPREIDGKAGVWTVTRFADGKVFCEDCEKELDEVYRLMEPGSTVEAFISPSPFCKDCAGIKGDEIVIRFPDFDAEAAARGGAS